MNKNRLDLLRIDILNHPLLEKNTTFSLVASQRVRSDNHDELTHLAGPIWINNVNTIVGRNASGKSLLIQLITGISNLLLASISIDQTNLNNALIGNNPIKVRAYLFGADKQLYMDEIEFSRNPKANEKWQITSEVISSKKINSSLSRSKIFDFSTSKVILDRDSLDTLQKSLLAPDDSMMRSVIIQNDYETNVTIDTNFLTNRNEPLIAIGTKNFIPSALLHYLDPTIEKLTIKQIDNKTPYYELKFINNEDIITDNIGTLEYYLSSGTVKGISLYFLVTSALIDGGTIFIDELENHFNLAIVRTFIEFFTNPKININRATLVFSTHYAELLDDLTRGDQIYVARRTDGLISIDRYSKIADRQDINRAEVFMSDYLGGTAPDYETYLDLKKSTLEAIKESGSVDA